MSATSSVTRLPRCATSGPRCPTVPATHNRDKSYSPQPDAVPSSALLPYNSSISRGHPSLAVFPS
ncbi:hypothetical protein BD626DRAFT_519402 [Schizophyllum amplum]|uniref:Uncharacterized protein n=1 Tax=Schizophyllum amplum TaxID=97359 RepID=A0A550BVE3_9AGAR|nr:hypothetical protein BD626DRAFT_519402 [Auriculariopsis ampla]